jgi:hypothetical protein
MTGAVKRDLTMEIDAGKGMWQECRKVFAPIVDGICTNC